MFKKILVALDGSKNAERSLPWARDYAAALRAPVVLVQVLEAVYPLKGLPFGVGAPEARAYLEDVARSFFPGSIPVTVALPSGPVARTLVETAVRERSGLMVIATRGNSKVVRWLAGGVTEQVLRLSPLPLLVVRGRPSEAGGPPPARILALLDGSDRDRGALSWSIRLARHHQAPLVFLHVVRASGSRSTKAGGLKEAWAERLERVSLRLVGQGLRASFRVEEGNPVREILKTLSPRDLVVLSSRGRGALKRWLLGSVAEKVIRQASVPFFILRKSPKSRASRSPGA